MPQQVLASLPFLASLANDRGLESRRILLRITTDHFISLHSHSARQIAQFEKAIERLMPRSDPATRLIVARKLARHPMTPPSVLEMILDMGGDGALHVLEFAPLPRERLLAAALGDEVRAGALARRADLDAELVAAVSVRPEPAVALALAGNPAAPLDASTLASLARRAERDRPLAAALLARPTAEIDPAALFLLANAEQRAAILATAQRAELGRPVGAAQSRPRDEAIARLERHALEREPDLFNEALSHALGCGRDLAERIAKEPSGEPLAVALAALGAPHDVAVRILVSGDLQSGAKYTRIGSLARLKHGLDPAAARRVMAALVGADEPRRERRRPVLDPTASATPSRAPAAGPSAPERATDAPRGPRGFGFADRKSG
ncbi:MAG: DUF2336 domain-containing protein [Roseiarcus sp.]|jgi:uncharacterized protein (DUF2336 family)